MKSIIYKFITIAMVAVFGIVILNSANSTYAVDNICNNPGVSQEIKAASGCGGNAGYLPTAVQNILNAVILVSSIVSVIFIVIGGFNYMTSSGDAAKIKKAKDTILYACIGLAVCALAFAIVNFVIANILRQ